MGWWGQMGILASSSNTQFVQAGMDGEMAWICWTSPAVPGRAQAGSDQKETNSRTVRFKSFRACVHSRDQPSSQSIKILKTNYVQKPHRMYIKYRISSVRNVCKFNYVALKKIIPVQTPGLWAVGSKEPGTLHTGTCLCAEHFTNQGCSGRPTLPGKHAEQRIQPPCQQLAHCQAHSTWAQHPVILQHLHVSDANGPPTNTAWIPCFETVIMCCKLVQPPKVNDEPLCLSFERSRFLLTTSSEMLVERDACKLEVHPSKSNVFLKSKRSLGNKRNEKMISNVKVYDG
jgi:hypothetical protein